MARFAPGQSGNLKGRPTDNKKAAAIRQRILKAAPSFVETLIDASIAGDIAAAKTLLCCAVPPLKPIELPVLLPIPPDAGIADQGRAVINALAQGLIAPGQAGMILTALAGVARLVELSEFEQRLRSLEAKP